VEKPINRSLTKAILLFSLSTFLFLSIFCGLYTWLKIKVYPPTVNELAYQDNNFNVLGLDIPKNLDFCGEAFPSNNYEIKKNLEREFYNKSYWQSGSGFLFQKARKWFPYIEPILKREGVPDDFKYVAVIESHLSNVVSPAGAAGFWQLVPTSARGYGLVVNDFVDERYHVEKATEAACKHFKDGYEIFKNWTLSAAAYNLGIGGLQNAMTRQNADNYYDLMLNHETAAFVYRILAYKTLLSNPAQFGLKKRKQSKLSKVPMKRFMIDTTIHDLKAFAKTQQISYAAVKLFNPWLLQNQLPVEEGQKFVIEVPKDNKDYSDYSSDLLGENGYIPQDETEPPMSAPDTLKTALATQTITHAVKEGELLSEIASFYELNEKEIRQWNKLTENEQPKVGTNLILNFKKNVKAPETHVEKK
jgi:membrane-bound lytic murein transglycosylase D